MGRRRRRTGSRHLARDRLARRRPSVGRGIRAWRIPRCCVSVPSDPPRLAAVSAMAPAAVSPEFWHLGVIPMLEVECLRRRAFRQLWAAFLEVVFLTLDP